MSVVFKINNCVFLDHYSYISQLYKNVSLNDNVIESYSLSKTIFIVKREEKKSIRRKRTLEDRDNQEEVVLVKQLYEEFIKGIADYNFKNLVMNADTDISSVRNFSKHLFESTLFEHNGIRGGNNSESPMRCMIQNESFLFPSNSKFLCGCVKDQCKKLIGNKYNVVVADPPWWNKYIRRLKNANSKLSYSMMYNEDIAEIPVKQLVDDNCLIAVWCTNSPSNVAAVKNLIFPAWGVDYLATWYWLKIAIDFKPLCEFGTGSKKQPYERIIIGKVGEMVNIPEKQLIISVPSALHSHKPPLSEILYPFLKMDNPQTLELFARYLLPNTTSVGYEPLKWQHISLYEKVD